MVNLSLALKVVAWLMDKHTGSLTLGPVVVGFTWRPPVRFAHHEGRRVWGLGLPHVFVWARLS